MAGTLKDRPYGDPAYNMPFPITFAGAVIATASTIFSRWVAPAAGRIRGLSAVVLVAGTVTGHGLDILLGTTSIGSITLSTTAAAGTATSGDLDTAVAVGQVLSLRNKADTTGTAAVVGVWEFSPGATFYEP